MEFLRTMLKCSFVAYLIFILNLVSCPTNGDHVRSHGNLIISYDEKNDSRSQQVLFPNERIVNDLISLEKGVHVDFSYNETGGSNDVVSAPGCPRSHEGRKWVYYGSPPRCYLVGFRGPCTFGRRMFAVENSKYGVCNCDCFAMPPPSPHSVTSTEDHVANNEVLILPRRDSRSRLLISRRKCNSTKTKRTTTTTTKTPSYSLSAPSMEMGENEMKNRNLGKRYQFCFSPMLQRLVVFDKLRQECNAFLDQGPCMKGQWLVKSMEQEDGIECEKRKCPEYMGYSEKDAGGGFTFFDYRKQECETQVYGALQDSFFSNTGGITADRQKYCRSAGMKYSHILKTCIRDIKTKFSFSIIG